MMVGIVLIYCDEGYWVGVFCGVMATEHITFNKIIITIYHLVERVYVLVFCVWTRGTETETERRRKAEEGRPSARQCVSGGFGLGFSQLACLLAYLLGRQTAVSCATAAIY